MRPDKTFVRILLIFSVANVAIAAPAAVRQRYLDVAKAASEKRAPGSDGGETGGLPPESSPPMPPHGDRPTDTSRWAWLLWPDSPDSSPAADNRITTQASGVSGSGNGATGDRSAGSSLRIPPHDSPTDKWAWLYRESLESSSTAEDRIMTQASGASGSGNGATGDLLPESSLRIQPHDSRPTNLDLPSSPGSSSASESPITTQALGLTSSSSTSSVHHFGPLSPSSPWPSSPSLSEADGHFSLPRKILLSLGVAGLIGSTAVSIYEVHKWLKHLYVPPLSPLSSADTSRVTCNLPQ